MAILGYIAATLGLYALYEELIFIGAMLIYVGGLMSGGFTIGISSISIITLISSLTYGIHNEFTTTIIILCLVSAVLAAASRGRGRWEFEFGLFDFDLSSGSGGGFGGDNGGGSGGGD